MPLPVRLSVNDEDFDPDLGARLEVRLDGVVQDAVIGFDTEVGEVIRARKDADGSFMVNQAGDQIEIETIKGAVTVGLVWLAGDVQGQGA